MAYLPAPSARARLHDVACLVLGLAFAWDAAYELFVDVPGVHYARVHFAPLVVAPNAPTLAAVGVGVGASLLLGAPLVARWRPETRPAIAWTGALVGVACELWAMFDVLGHAMEGIG